MMMLSLVWTGCSDDTVRGSVEPSPYLTAPVTRYFPIADGYSTQLSVSYADGGSANHTYVIGAPQMYNYYTAYPLRVYSNSSLISTNYVVVTDSALFIFENGGSAPAKVLDLPLYSGRSWDRSDETELTGLSEEPEDESGGDDPEGGQTEDGGGSDNQLGPQLFPSSVGQQTMTVQGRETVYLPDGQAFSGTYRVRNENISGGKNYYWYAPGVGLVKYVINADPNDINQGAEVGVLTGFGIGLRK
jgi:hypothetical protein